MRIGRYTFNSTNLKESNTLFNMDSTTDAIIQKRLHSDSQTVNNVACTNCEISTAARDTSTSVNSFHYRRRRHHHDTNCHTHCIANATASVSVTTSATLRRLCLALLLFSLFSSAYSCGPGRGIGGPRRNRKLTPLVFKQHVPNMSEKNMGASSLNEGPVRRDSPKFKKLVPNYNRDIIFKDEEGTGADRLMTQRCKEKLNTLAVSVMNQWPGVRLRVTESWDEDNLHGADSLHYEGRAVDITTSDRDRTKYGMLARLAVEAGFDWVYYESRAHIHCSVKSDSSHISHVSGCFTSDSTVLTSSGEHKAMAMLQIGDQVLTMTENGEAKYSEVILFMDRQLDMEQEFVEIHAEGGAKLTVTPSHLVMVWNQVASHTEYRFADKVEEGDLVFVGDVATSIALRPQRVVELRAVQHRGVVAPLTREGTIVVNSVAASCYAIVNSQLLAHWSMMPMRLLATLKAWLPQNATLSSERRRYNVNSPQNGIHWYSKSLYALKDYVVPLSWRYQ